MGKEIEELASKVIDMAYHLHQEVGLLINFGGIMFKDNVKRIMNDRNLTQENLFPLLPFTLL